MRLAIINLTGGGFSGGYKKYLKNMLPRLSGHSGIDALMCVSPEGNDISAWFRKQLPVEYCSCSPFTFSHMVFSPDRKMLDCLIKFSPDIIFLPVDRYIRFNSLPVVNMMRNMEPFVPNMKGDTLKEVFKKFIQRKITCNSIRRADHTIAVSNFVKEYITDKIHVPDSKVSQVYHGMAFRSGENRTRPLLVPAGWEERGFIFTCGSVRPARGLEDVLEALSDLAVRNLDTRLVIAGETVPGMIKYRETLKQLLVLKGLTERVCWAGSLNDEELYWCYDKCSLFIMTSRIEACPNIAIEAMSSGAISIAADNPPLPELFADCAKYYEAGNGHSLAKVILDQMALGPDTRKALSERSKERSSMFSWDLTVNKTISVLMRVLEQSKNKRF